MKITMALLLLSAGFGCSAYTPPTPEELAKSHARLEEWTSSRRRPLSEPVPDGRRCKGKDYGIIDGDQLPLDKMQTVFDDRGNKVGYSEAFPFGSFVNFYAILCRNGRQIEFYNRTKEVADGVMYSLRVVDGRVTAYFADPSDRDTQFMIVEIIPISGDKQCYTAAFIRGGAVGFYMKDFGCDYFIVLEEGKKAPTLLKAKVFPFGGNLETPIPTLVPDGVLSLQIVTEKALPKVTMVE